MFGIALAFTLVWWAITRDARLLHDHVDTAVTRGALRRFGLGMTVYAACIALSYVNAYLTLAVHGALAIYYCFDQFSPAPARATPIPRTEPSGLRRCDD
jgi:hypothetical protein